MPQASAIIIADSISPEGIRLTTFQLQYWRPIHSELMTHRVFSRNAGSSRARPSAKIIEQVRNDPWGPIHWGKNEPGMQASVELEGEDLNSAIHYWKMQAEIAATGAELLNKLGVHKQAVNRLLEPFTYIDVVVTATDFANWFALRDHADAQPEIRELAQLMREVYDHSEPKLLKPGEWHLPYITDEDLVEARSLIDPFASSSPPWHGLNALDLLMRASAARCARVSYKLHDGNKTDFAKDLELFERLLVSQPLHASPAEHQATPDRFEHDEFIVSLDRVNAPMMPRGKKRWINPQLHGNFRGWCQHRKMLPNEFVAG